MFEKVLRLVWGRGFLNGLLRMGPQLFMGPEAGQLPSTLNTEHPAGCESLWVFVGTYIVNILPHCSSTPSKAHGEGGS